jgi:hypothetical protein
MRWSGTSNMQTSAKRAIAAVATGAVLIFVIAIVLGLI